MKKFLPLIFASLIMALSGCAGIKKQNNIEEQMKNLVFNAPADRVYSAAIAEMSNPLTPKIKSTGQFSGASDWVYSDYVFGGKVNKRKTRTLISVTAKGNKQSILRIQTETATNFMGDFGEPHVVRFLTNEYNTLKRVNPVQAAEIDKMASAK
ncbi:MAG: hypothetical protein OEW97_04480 [Gammaproteobacteria bacterium]|nr:hypothetical protein [Gammaproteobacteria bacterium]